MENSLFAHYRRPGKDEFLKLWNEGKFVLDTSVLLNLYRYPRETRDDLMRILERLIDRLWFPYQVALEYHDNLLKETKSQLSGYRESRDALEKTQKKLREQLSQDQYGYVDKAFTSFLKKLHGFEEEQLAAYDKLRDRIDQILEGRIGPLPAEGRLQQIYEEGKERYDTQRPPGYVDAQKKQGYIHHRGLAFDRKYGDLILWFQIIEQAKTQEDFKYVVLVIDDKKGDWWLDVKGETIGPRPELIEEMKSEAGISLFHMYNSERFMHYAKEYLRIRVRQESIEQIRDVTRATEREGRIAPSGIFEHPTAPATITVMPSGVPTVLVTTSERGGLTLSNISSQAVSTPWANIGAGASLDVNPDFDFSSPEAATPITPISSLQSDAEVLYVTSPATLGQFLRRSPWSKPSKTNDREDKD